MSLTGNAEGFERTRKRWKACATVNSLCIFYRGQRSQNPWLNTQIPEICCCCVCVLSVCWFACVFCVFLFSLCVFIFLECRKELLFVACDGYYCMTEWWGRKPHSEIPRFGGCLVCTHVLVNSKSVRSKQWALWRHEWLALLGGPPKCLLFVCFLLVFLRDVCVCVRVVVWIDSFGANAPSPGAQHHRGGMSEIYR